MTEKALATTGQTALATTEKAKPFQVVPKTMQEAMDFAKVIADSDLAPKDFKGKPGNVMIAMQMGAEVGLSPMASIQNIAVINGRPSLWGDSMLAVCQTHKDFEGIEEYFDEQGTAVCTIKRKGFVPHTQTFSLRDVTLGGYDKKPGPWQTSRKRMMQMRARAFALRDRFADALRGLVMAEEAMDMEPVQVTVMEPRKADQDTRVLDKITQGSKKVEESQNSKEQDNSKNDTPPAPDNTTAQEETTKPENDSCAEGNEAGNVIEGEILYAGSPEDIYKEVMTYFDNTKDSAHAFIAEVLGKGRIKKMKDLQTLTQDEMTKLWNSLQEAKAMTEEES